jgi:methionyl-tRNA formyltransferase
MKKFKVLYFGTWGYGLAGLKALAASGSVELTEIFTKWDSTSDNPYLNRIYEFAYEKNYRIFNSDKKVCSRIDFEKEISLNKPFDFIVSCCFDRIFSPEILAMPQIIALNVHPSLLPKYRGVKPLENAIINDDKFTGITIHELVPELDAGDILLQEGRIEINPRDTYENLYDAQCRLIEKLLGDYFKDPLSYINNKKKQDSDLVSFAPRLNFEIRNSESAEEIRKKARQFSV